jgi:hypothetical protein
MYAQATDGNGVLDSIIANLHISFFNTGLPRTYQAQAALYQYIDYGVDYIGDQIALSDVVQWINKDNYDVTELTTFNFSAPKPSITDLTNYYLLIWADECQDGTIQILSSDTDSRGVYEIRNFSDGWRDPWINETAFARVDVLYASYTPTTTGTTKIGRLRGVSHWGMLPFLPRRVI